MAEPYPPDLPAWMRPHRRRVDWGLVAILAIGLVVVAPLALWPGLSPHSDAALFVARSAQVAETLRSGVLYTRWAPDFNFSFGSPLFDYLAPLPHTLAGLHQMLTDADPVSSIKLWLAASVLLAGSGMYLATRHRFGPIAGVIAGLTYLLSTPIAAEVVASGNFATLLSLGLLPWAMLAVDRLIRQPTKREIVLAALALALWGLADTRLTLVGIVLFVVPLGEVAILVIRKEAAARATLLAVGLASVAAVLLTAFFWLPALAEQNAAIWIPLADDPRGGGIPLAEIFSVPQFVPDALNQLPLRGVGLGVAIGAILGAVAILAGAIAKKRWRTIRWDAVTFGILGLGGLIIATPAIAVLWPPMSGWEPIRPYDLLIGVGLPGLALLSGQIGRWFDRAVGERHILRAMALIAFSLPSLLSIAPVSVAAWHAPIYSAVSGNTTLDETNLHAIATLRYGLLLPAVAYRPLRSPLTTVLQLRYGLLLPTIAHRPSTSLTTIVFARLPDVPYLSPDALLVNRTPLASQFTVMPTHPGETVELDRLAFPGWLLAVNNNPYPTTISSDGLLTFTPPISSNEVTLTFGSTLDRDVGWLMAIAGLVLVSIQTARRESQTADVHNLPDSQQHWSAAEASALCILILIATCGVVAAHFASVSSANTAINPPLAIYENGVELDQVSVDADHASPGQTLTLTLIWQTRIRISQDAQLIVQLMPNGSPDATPINAATEWQPGGIPLNQWPAGVSVMDRLILHVPPNAPTGAYRLVIGLGQCLSPQRLPCETTQPIPPIPSSGTNVNGALLPIPPLIIN